MGATLSRGAAQLRGWLATYLQATLPAMVTQAVGDWSLQPWQLPAPVVYDTYDLPIIGTNQYPAIGADFPNEGDYERSDWTDRAEQVYWANYSGSVYVWVATARDGEDHLETPHRESCLRQRDDMTELVKQALLLHPDLGQGQDTCWLDESTVTVNKMDPFRAGENRPDFVAGSLIPVVYRVKSELSLPVLGAANDIELTLRKLHD